VLVVTGVGLKVDRRPVGPGGPLGRFPLVLQLALKSAEDLVTQLRTLVRMVLDGVVLTGVLSVAMGERLALGDKP
jgi:hypothetical protein